MEGEVERVQWPGDEQECCNKLSSRHGIAVVPGSSQHLWFSTLIPAQNQASQHSKWEGSGCHKVPLLAEELLAVIVS